MVGTDKEVNPQVVQTSEEEDEDLEKMKKKRRKKMTLVKNCVTLKKSPFLDKC